MRFYQAVRDIDASPDTVWKILTDKNALLAAKLGILRLEGDISPNAKITLWSEASPKRPFKLRVSTFDAPRKMVWSGGMPFGLFTGTRLFDLVKTETGTTFTMREEFSGLMMPLIWKSMPDLQRSFEKFVDGVKILSEAKT